MNQLHQEQIIVTLSSSIKKLNLTDRTINCLIRNNVRDLSTILSLDIKELKDFRGMTEEIKNELANFLIKMNPESLTCINSIFKVRDNHNFILKKMKIRKKLDKAKASKIIYEYLNKNEFIQNEENFINFLNYFKNTNFYNTLCTNQILTKLSKNKQGVSLNNLKRLTFFNINILNNLIQEQKVLLDNNKYFIYYGTYINQASQFLDIRKLQILNYRLHGYTYAQIADIYSISNERVRQILNVIKKECKLNIYRFKEDTYSDIYCTSNLVEKKFKQEFSINNYTYNIYKFHYKK